MSLFCSNVPHQESWYEDPPAQNNTIMNFSHEAILLLVRTFINNSLHVDEKQPCNELQMINAQFRLIYNGRFSGKLGAGAICL